MMDEMPVVLHCEELDYVTALLVRTQGAGAGISDIAGDEAPPTGEVMMVTPQGYQSVIAFHGKGGE